MMDTNYKNDRRGSGLKMSGILIVSLLLAAACGSDDNAGGSRASQADVENAGGSISVAGWQFYQTDHQASGSVEADWSYLNTDPDILIQARGGTANILNSSSASMSALGTLDVLQPIDTTLLSNYQSIPESLRDDPTWQNANGDIVAVPFAVSVNVTAFDTSVVSEPTALDDLLTAEYAGGIGLFDTPDIIAQIAVAQGVEDTTKITQAEFDRAMQFLVELRPNVTAFFGFGEDVQLFNRGDIVLSLSSFGSILTEAIEQNPAIEWNLLAETTFIDAWSVLDLESDAEALNWIDRTISAEGQTAIVDESGAYPVAPDAIEALTAFGDPVSSKLGGLSLDEILEQAPIARGFAAEAEGDVVTIDEATRAWNDYKASF